MPTQITDRARLLGLLGVILGIACCAAAYWYFSLSHVPEVTAAQVLSALGVVGLLGAAAVAALAWWLVHVARAARPTPLLQALQSAAGGRLLVAWLVLVAAPTTPHLVLNAVDADPLLADATVVVVGLLGLLLTGVIVQRVNRSWSRA